MEKFPIEFIKAFNFTMTYEVGPKFNSKDPEVIAGLCATKEQQRKTGYVNHKNDTGGETKFGIAHNANKDINIKELTLQKAMEIYYKRYWLAGKCDKMKSPLSEVHFDACVNHGTGRAAKLLQQSLGLRADGIIGINTIAAINSKNPQHLAQKQLEYRKKFFNAIVESRPTQNVFLRGWMARVDSVETFLA